MNAFGKLMTHNSALYTPALRASSQHTLLFALSGNFSFPAHVWKEMCDASIAMDGTSVDKAGVCCCRKARPYEANQEACINLKRANN